MYLQMQINGFISIFSEMEPRQGRASQEQQMALLEFMEKYVLPLQGYKFILLLVFL